MARLGTGRPPSSLEDQPKDLRELVEAARKRKAEMEKFHEQYRNRWDHFDGLYHNFDDLKRQHKAAVENDRDAGKGVLLEARRDWGGDLHIPYAYATIETVVPRVVTNRPRVHAKPLEDGIPRAHRQAIADLINQQQANVNYELLLQPTVRRGLKLGLGVQKLYWDTQKRLMDRTVPDGAGGYRVVEQEVVLRDAPMFEDVDVYDFLWDPAAKSITACDDVIHRTWRPFSYVKRQVEEGKWFSIDLEAVEGMGKTDRFNQLWSRRRESQGLNQNPGGEAGKVHEVWEWHRRGHIVTILDETFVVVNDRAGSNTPGMFPHRDLPFQIYRPTIQEGQFVGKGEIEPIEHLIAELNTLRTQRRDNATAVLNRVYAYTEGFIRKKDLKFSPGWAIPTQGDPREALYQLPVQDIPSSGYQEEAALKADIELASGITDPVLGTGGGGDETATGKQLAMQAANVRIGLKGRNLLLETVAPAVWQQLELNRRYVLEGRQIRIDDPQHPDGFRFIDVTPEILAAHVELVPEEHSTEPENRVQRMNDAMALYEAFGQNPLIDQTRLIEHVLSEAGLRDIQGWIANQNEIPAEAVAEAARRAIVEEMVRDGAKPEEAEQMAEERVLQLVQEAQGVAQELKAVQQGTNGSQPQAA